ncbi:MAG: type VII secretion protein EssC [Bacilli bacterium]
MKNNKVIYIYTDLEKKVLSIKNQDSLISEVVITKEKRHYLNFVIKEGQVFTYILDKLTNLQDNVYYVDNNFSFLKINEVKSQIYSLQNETLISIGNEDYHLIRQSNIKDQTTLYLKKEKVGYILYYNPLIKVYHNNVLLSNDIRIEAGDIIDVLGVNYIINDNNIEVIDYVLAINKIRLIEVHNPVSLKKVSSIYKRSPRIIYPGVSDDLLISNPPSKEKTQNQTLLKIVIPPLLTISVTILMSIVLKRGAYVLMAMATSLLSIIMAISNYFKQRKDVKEKNIKREEVYNKYLIRKLKEIKQAIIKQEQALNYHYPSNDVILGMLLDYSSRMYEKNSLNHDFLEVRIAMAHLDYPFKIKFDEKDFSEEEDALFDEAKTIAKRFKKSDLLPTSINLSHGAIGLVGQEGLLNKQMALLINQIAFFHSYHDVEIINVFKEEDYPFYKNFAYLPHFNSKVIHVQGFVYSKKTSDQVLNSFYQVLKQRSMEYQENSSGGASLIFTPHFILNIIDLKQIIDHSIMEFLSKDVSHLGVHVIYLDRSIKNLPEHVSSIIEYKNEDEGAIVTINKEYVNTRFKIDHLRDDFPLDLIPRIMAGYEHVLSLESQIPDKVGFLEMFDVKDVKDLNIVARWMQNNPGKTLAVPLGYRGPKDIVYLNLHEKAHGPHGLVAGTTGSGKSEIVQSYILSLALNFHPYDVGFLLIDYKGGGMANLFKDLPHLLGTITNLDGAASMRALISIKAELKRRQQLFSDNDVNHIDAYQKLYKEKKVKEAMPHLFMISDEFAELKAEQPEFMKELVSTARIGRSLGIHLILATQKPSGVVDDQIWSNSKFKLCLKVANDADSNEMLKTKDAASITKPGLAYLQVGNNEIYELFQSAYSGAPYLGNSSIEEVSDNRIYQRNELGQFELKSQDLSKTTIKSNQDELQAVVGAIKEQFEMLQLEKVASPWLEPLPEILYLDDLEENPIVKDKVNLQAVIGLSDEPQFQAQNILSIDLNQGNTAIFGLSGFGKSNMIQSILLSLIKKNTPKQLYTYIIDCGGALLSFKQFPHVADLITLDEEEKLMKWARLIKQEMAQRKAMFKAAEVSDVSLYEEFKGEQVSRILILIDNYDALKEANTSDEFDKLLMQISREGINLGIHMMLSASRPGVLRYNFSTNFKTKTVLFTIDKSDTNEVVGRNSLVIDEIPGRAMIKLEEPTLYQSVLPIKLEDASSRLKAIREYAAEYNASYEGYRPSEIPIVPDILTIAHYQNIISNNSINKTSNYLNVGIDMNEVKPVVVDLKQDSALGICFDRIDANDSIIKTG